MPDTDQTTTTTTTDYSAIGTPLPTDGTADFAEIVAAVNGLKTAAQSAQSAELTTAQEQALQRVTQFFGL